MVQLVKHLPGNAGDASKGALISWRREWQPTPVYLPGKFYGQGSLVSYSAWDYKESDTTKHTHTPTHPHPHTHPHCSHHVQARAVSSLQAVCSRHKSKSKSRTIACSLLQNTWTVLFMSFIINFSLGYDSHFLFICMSSNFCWILNIMNLTFLKAGFCFVLLRSVEFSGK